MQEDWLRIIADDLTGACDVAAALLPIPAGLVVENPSRWETPRTGVLADAWVVRNTQSRTLAPAPAATRVGDALRAASARWRGVVLKKIDTGLRGPLGAEVDAAMAAAGADVTVVLAAIPEAGRSTVDGRQLVDGVPVHQTAFARDPHNPVTDSRVGAVIEATSRWRTANVGMDEVVRCGAGAAVARARAEGVGVVVGDAVTDEDLDLWVRGLGMHGPSSDPIVLAGSTGLARALRRGLRGLDGEPAPSPLARPRGQEAGVLVVAGSAHPTTHTQLAHAETRELLCTTSLDVGAPLDSAAEITRRLESGRHAALTVPSARIDGRRVLAAIVTATRAVVERRAPRAILLVGGETAFHVLAALGDPRLWIEGSPAPLAVRSVVLDGPLAGTPVVTKGGSSGPPERLADLLRELAR